MDGRLSATFFRVARRHRRHRGGRVKYSFVVWPIVGRLLSSIWARYLQLIQSTLEPFYFRCDLHLDRVHCNFYCLQFRFVQRNHFSFHHLFRCKFACECECTGACQGVWGWKCDRVRVIDTLSLARTRTLGANVGIAFIKRSLEYNHIDRSTLNERPAQLSIY